jgi:hypothetical protein
MRRFYPVLVLFLLSLPMGMSVVGCKHNYATFCDGGDSGLEIGQISDIDLEPKTTGISLNYGETGQLTTPHATDCKGNTVNVTGYTYGTSNMNIIDVSPTGSLCAGNWNRNSPAGIADYTTCTATNQVGIAYLTASASTSTSNTVAVYAHLPVTSMVLNSQPGCVSQGTTEQFSTTIYNLGTPIAGINIPVTSWSITSGVATFTASSALPTLTVGQPINLSGFANGTSFNGLTVSVVSFNTTLRQFSANVLLSNASGTETGAIATTTIGNVTYTSQNSSIVTIDNSTALATAQQPGTTLITANVSDASSTAGYFYTCPPVNITITPTTTTGSNIVINPHYNESLSTTVTDVNGHVISGLNLEYYSTAPATTTVGSTGVITANFAGASSITAACQPSSCNPAPLNETGMFGTGKPVTSNTINVTTPGTTSSVLYMASTQSQFFATMDFTTSIIGTPVRLPYIPNSMVSDPNGNNLYLGSSTELMIVSPATGTVTKEDLNVPGTVLGVSPDGNLLIISDPVHNLVYIYPTSGGNYSSFGGTGTKAAFTPDSQTVYISGGNNIYVYSNATGWNAYPATTTAVNDVTVTSPGVGAFFAGAATTARSYCPISGGSAPIFYPASDTVAVNTAKVSATNDGRHILGANVAGGVATLYDIGITTPVGACPTNSAATFSSTLLKTAPSTSAATAITGVPIASNSSLAFITYTGTSGKLPGYIPAAGTPGTSVSVALATGATAPVAGIFSPDNLSFFVGTSGDNLVHVINTTTLTDSSQINPALPLGAGTNGQTVPVNLLAVKPRSVT